MHLRRRIKKLLAGASPGEDGWAAEQLTACGRGYAAEHAWQHVDGAALAPDASNPLRALFNARQQGPGIWKWDHYFDIYDRHLSRFRGRDVGVLEIGIYSGGSLDMWRGYFGPRGRIYGVDIEPACKAYENESVRVFIGDQADHKFWRKFRREVPALDVVIDDGGHQPEQQIVSLEELLAHLRPGGIYLCEDIHGAFNLFASYMQGLWHRLNAFEKLQENPDNFERRLLYRTTAFQSAVGSIHLYPFVAVIERNSAPVPELISPKHGTQWQPFIGQ